LVGDVHFHLKFALTGTLHSKLVLDFISGLKVCIFGKFLQ